MAIGSLFYSSYYALIGFVAKHTHQRFNQYFLVIIPFIWAGFEWLKKWFLQNPLGNIGYSLLMQNTSLYIQLLAPQD